MAPISGHVYRFEGKRRPTWRAKYRLPDGRQVKKTIGPAWTARGRPPAGFFTQRTAEQWLAGPLPQAFTGLRRGELIALRWRDIDFTASPVRVCGSFAAGRLTSPKSGHVRSIPMAPDVATTLAR